MYLRLYSFALKLFQSECCEQSWAQIRGTCPLHYFEGGGHNIKCPPPPHYFWVR